MAALVFLEVDLFFPEGSDLKGKRKQLQSVKAQIQRRFGAAVAETAHHDKWQRARLSCALVGAGGEPAARADSLERWVLSRFPDGAAFRRAGRTSADLLDDYDGG